MTCDPAHLTRQRWRTDTDANMNICIKATLERVAPAGVRLRQVTDGIWMNILVVLLRLRAPPASRREKASVHLEHRLWTFAVLMKCETLVISSQTPFHEAFTSLAKHPGQHARFEWRYVELGSAPDHNCHAVFETQRFKSVTSDFPHAQRAGLVAAIKSSQAFLRTTHVWTWFLSARSSIGRALIVITINLCVCVCACVCVDMFSYRGGGG